MTHLGGGLHIVEFGAGTLRFLDQIPATVPQGCFLWMYLSRDALPSHQHSIQHAAQTIGGSTVMDLHMQDLGNAAHPSHYDFTSVYDLVVFRRLATEQELEGELSGSASERDAALASFRRIRSRAVGFAVFDRLLISVHPQGCFVARAFMDRYLADALHGDGLSTVARSRLPTHPQDLMLRMVDAMVDSYLDLRKVLSAELDQWQQQLLAPRARGEANWGALMTARSVLRTLDDLCEEQEDAMQAWLETVRTQPASPMSQADHERLLARARDVIEHIGRVVQHVRRMEHDAETAVQIHFSALSHRTNEVMRVLTALTAVFLPLNFITGFFGMNFEFLPLIHSAHAMWAILWVMAVLALVVIAVFWRKRYLARTGR